MEVDHLAAENVHRLNKALEEMYRHAEDKDVDYPPKKEMSTYCQCVKELRKRICDKQRIFNHYSSLPEPCSHDDQMTRPLLWKRLKGDMAVYGEHVMTLWDKSREWSKVHSGLKPLMDLDGNTFASYFALWESVTERHREEEKHLQLRGFLMTKINMLTCSMGIHHVTPNVPKDGNMTLAEMETYSAHLERMMTTLEKARTVLNKPTTMLKEAEEAHAALTDAKKQLWPYYMHSCLNGKKSLAFGLHVKSLQSDLLDIILKGEVDEAEMASGEGTRETDHKTDTADNMHAHLYQPRAIDQRVQMLPAEMKSPEQLREEKLWEPEQIRERQEPVELWKPLGEPETPKVSDHVDHPAGASGDVTVLLSAGDKSLNTAPEEECMQNGGAELSELSNSACAPEETDAPVGPAKKAGKMRKAFRRLSRAFSRRH